MSNSERDTPASSQRQTLADRIRAYIDSGWKDVDGEIQEGIELLDEAEKCLRSETGATWIEAGEAAENDYARQCEAISPSHPATATPRTKREFYDRAVAELNLDVSDPFTNLLANAFALVDQRDQLERDLVDVRRELAQSNKVLSALDRFGDESLSRSIELVEKLAAAERREQEARVEVISLLSRVLNHGLDESSERRVKAGGKLVQDITNYLGRVVMLGSGNSTPAIRNLGEPK